MNTAFFIIGQVLTLVSYVVFWMSRFKKNKKNILIWDNVSRFFAIISFIFLGTYDGIKNTLYVVLRNIVGQVTHNKSQNYKTKMFIIMLIILISMYCFNFRGISTMFIAICGIINLYGVIITDEQGIRKFGMLGSLFYMAFLASTQNITGVICEIICFFVMLTSYVKYKKVK